MSKNAEGWIRHRGGKCPVDAGVKVDYRMRDGSIDDFGRKSETLDWAHYSEIGDIMAYKLHIPAEQVEACSKPDPRDSAKRDSDYVCWMRDRITEIDRTAEALEEERVSLVQRLEGEGFRLIERINAGIADAMQAHEDMSDWRNWKVGDEVVYTSDMYENLYTTGKSYKVKSVDTSTVSVFDDLGGNSACCFDDLDVNKLRWVSRPSA